MKNSETVIGAYLAVGVGVGTALGVALDNIAVGIALGVAFGLLAGVFVANRNKNAQAEDKDNESS